MPKVLIVDDDKFTLSVLQSVFTQDPTIRGLCFEVETALNGEDGLKAFRLHKPDLVVTDLLMPKMDGFALCKEIRNHPDGGDVPIAIISGVYRDPMIAVRVKREFNARFFTKPYQVKDLASHVAQIFGHVPSTEIRTQPRVPIEPISQKWEGDGGELSGRGLPAVLFDLLDNQATGLLILKRGQVTKEIELFVGHPIGVSSNVREETLGQLLRRDSVITEEELQNALKRAKERKEKIGAALIAIDALTTEQLVEQLTAQARYKISTALRWPDGVWKFEPSGNTSKRGHGNAIDMVELVLDALCETATVEPLPPNVAAAQGQRLALTERGQKLLPAIRRVVSKQLARGWRDGQTIEEIIEKGVPQVEAYIALDVLLLTEAVRTDGSSEPSGIKHLSDGVVSVDGLSKNSLTLSEPSPHEDSTDQMMYQSLFDDSAPSHTAAIPLSVDEQAVLQTKTNAIFKSAEPPPLPPKQAAKTAPEQAAKTAPEQAAKTAPEQAAKTAPKQAAKTALPTSAPDQAAKPALPTSAPDRVAKPASLPRVTQRFTSKSLSKSLKTAGVTFAATDKPTADAGDDKLDLLDVTDLAQPIEEFEGEDTSAKSARRMLLVEYLRLQGLNHYEILEVSPSANAATISAAVAERHSRFSMDFFSRFELGRDYGKLEELHATYFRASQALLDDKRRATYDIELRGEVSPYTPAALEAEVAFGAAKVLLDKKQFGAAIIKLKEAVRLDSDEAAYHADLGWANFLRGNRDARAADAARPHINDALAINPDHARAHEYKGIIGAALGSDDTEAIFHLERALDLNPRLEAPLATLEALHAKLGEFRPLERLYRKLIHKASGRDKNRELDLWLKLAALYQSQLSESESAQIALASARRLAPNDESITARIADLASGGLDDFHEKWLRLRNKWREDPADVAPVTELFELAVETDRHDTAFIAASVRVALGDDDKNATELYGRFRPRFLIRAQRQFDQELWDEARYPGDSPAVDALFAQLAPIINATAPLGLADLEVEEGTELDESDLPASFVRTRDYVAHILMVDVPKVYARSDFGRQIHVGAVTPPVLLAGDDALASPERAELAFRLGRAMTYLRPGRAFAGSHPSSFLKQVVLAAFSVTNPGVPINDPDSTIEPLRKLIEELPDSELSEVRDLVNYITDAHSSLDLSRWVQALARTGDRVGLLLCGDLPAAARFVSDSGGQDAIRDLFDFAFSPAMVRLRAMAGLSIDV